MQRQMQRQDEMDNYFLHGIVSASTYEIKDFVFETEYCMKKDNYITWIVPLNAKENDLFIFYNSDENEKIFKSKMRLYVITEIISPNGGLEERKEYFRIVRQKKWTKQQAQGKNICKMVNFFNRLDFNLITKYEYNRHISNCDWNMFMQSTQKYTDIKKINSLKNALNHIIYDKINTEEKRLKREQDERLDEIEQERRERQHNQGIISANKRLSQQLNEADMEIRNKNLELQRLRSRGRCL
tara:strand:+ start:1020 stop:1742 length:723 start_codon:yes stop_codon:yes gene_type:complete